MTNSLRPCTCRAYEVGNRINLANGDVDFVDVRTTGCNASTTRMFAQGHDAKLVSFLVAAELDSLEIALVDGSTSWGSAELAVRMISDALADKAANMLATAHGKAAKKATAKTRESEKVNPALQAMADHELTIEEVTATPEPLLPIESRIKVGRWVYNAQIDRTTRAATYATKLGSTKTAEQGTYTEV